LHGARSLIDTIYYNLTPVRHDNFSPNETDINMMNAGLRWADAESSSESEHEERVLTKGKPLAAKAAHKVVSEAWLWPCLRTVWDKMNN
jgi:hypothetical protein